MHEQIFGWILTLVAERGLVKGERIGVDGSTMEANAALRSSLRRDSGVTYREMLMQMALTQSKSGESAVSFITSCFRFRRSSLKRPVSNIGIQNRHSDAPRK